VELKRLWRKRLEIDEMLARPNSNGTPVGDLMKSRAEVERCLATAELELVRSKRSGGARRCSAADTRQRNQHKHIDHAREPARPTRVW
jgi:hypothetical protein